MSTGPAPSPPPVARVHRDRPGPWFAWGSPAGFEWTAIALPVPRLPGPLARLRILHLSDLHARRAWPPAYDELIRRLAADPPDLILFTGDFIDDKHDPRPALPNLRRLVPALKSRLGTYAILGNHDPAHAVPDIAAIPGLHLLDARRATLQMPGAAVELIGLPGCARHDLDDAFVASIPPREPDTLRIVLSHYPDMLRLVRPLAPDLFLAGHTHGGQVCLPGGVPLITHDGLPRKFAKGVHRVGDTWLVVSRGFGCASLPVRLFCPPEVAEITVLPYDR